MKKFLKVLVAMFLVLLLAVTGIVIWQWENIRAVYVFMTTDEQTIATHIEAQRFEQEAILEQYEVSVQALTIEQSNALLDGKVDPEEIKKVLGIIREADEEMVGEETKNKSAADEKKVQELINQCIAELYACEVDLMAEFGEMKKRAINEWNALDHNTRTKEDLQAIGLAGLSQCYKKEVVVDRQVKEILERCRTQLKALNADTSILDTIWKYYCDKKTNQKAYYLNKYMD